MTNQLWKNQPPKLKRPPSSRGDPPAKKTKQLKRPAVAAEAAEAVEAVESAVSKALKKSAATALEDPPPTAAAAGPSPRPDAAGESENPKNAGMDSSVLPNAARSYKDTTGNWEAGFFRNNWMVFVTLFVFTICLSLSLTLSQFGRCLSSCDRQGTWRARFGEKLSTFQKLQKR